MKYLLFILGFCALFCGAVNGSDKSISVDDLLESKSSFDGKEVLVVGRLLKEKVKVQGFSLGSFIKNEVFIDLVFAESAKEIELIDNFHDECIQIKGVFKEYNKSFIGLGNLTSDYGLIEARHYSSCSNTK